MQYFLLSYLLRPLLYLIASLPFWILYRISDFLFLITYYVTRYRQKIILKNLRNAFPEKSEQEIKVIMRKYYVFFCDILVETLKMLTISPKEMIRRAKYIELESIEHLRKEKKSFFIILGHSGSWEWASPAFELISEYKVLVIYKPLTNAWMDNFVLKLRTRFGQEATSMRNTLRSIIKLKDKMTVTAFIGDQRPNPEDAYWTKFLGQDTGFLWGTEKLAQKFDRPVVFAEITRPKRGFYEIRYEMLEENPTKTQTGEITEKFARRLEQQIRQTPELWLWSHDRWKHQKP